MRNIILFDDEHRDKLLPLVYTRPTCELRIGISTIREKWERNISGHYSFITQSYLAEKFPTKIDEANLIINGSLLPDPTLVELIKGLELNEALMWNQRLLAANLDKETFELLIEDKPIQNLKGIDYETEDIQLVNYPYDIFSYNRNQITYDFHSLTQGRKSIKLDDSNKLKGEENIFVEPGAIVQNSIINAELGPVYIGAGAEIMDGAIVRGPLAMCKNSVLKMGAKVYGATTLGPYCKVGGEVNNIVMLGYSSKAHDGFLGNSVIGEWCNLGADTNSSNLKNNYAEVKLWSYETQGFHRTGLQFCGLVMGDHSKCGINTMFNTGTVVGVNANIYGSNFPRNFIPSFSWGGAKGFKTYTFDKAMETAEIVMKRRNIKLSDADKRILQNVFEQTSDFRVWDSKKLT